MDNHNLFKLFNNAITLDNAQKNVLKIFSKLSNQITDYLKLKDQLFKQLFKKAIPPKGIYLYGKVGRGKSMLTEHFYNNLHINKKFKIHFHDFMILVHSKLKEQRSFGKKTQKDNYLKNIALIFAKKYDVIYLDELHIDDITDAMIVGKLFQYLFDAGIIITITSNFYPDQLYSNGLQRESFLGFIELIKEKLDIVNLDGKQDYRLAKIKDMNTVFYTDLGQKADDFIQSNFDILSQNNEPHPRIIEINGRKLECPITYKDIAVFDFIELCIKPLGTADYQALAKNFNIIMLKNIPALRKEDRNEAKRLVNLIDSLYQNKRILICTSAVDPTNIYPYIDPNISFERTVSRLIEMQSEQYLKNLDVE